jgi:hypothetical protein
MEVSAYHSANVGLLLKPFAKTLNVSDVVLADNARGLATMVSVPNVQSEPSISFSKITVVGASSLTSESECKVENPRLGFLLAGFETFSYAASANVL